MATIKIKRTSEWINAARNVKIFIDENFVGKIADGETVEFPITAGQHTVAAKIDWCSSPNVIIDIETDEVKHLAISGFKYNWLMVLGIGSICFFPVLKRIIGSIYAILLLMPLFLFSLYYLTIGCNKYLTLNETSKK